MSETYQQKCLNTETELWLSFFIPKLNFSRKKVIEGDDKCATESELALGDPNYKHDAKTHFFPSMVKKLLTDKI